MFRLFLVLNIYQQYIYIYLFFRVPEVFIISFSLFHCEYIKFVIRFQFFIYLDTNRRIFIVNEKTLEVTRMSYEYDPRQLGSQRSGQSSRVLTDQCEEMLFDFSGGESSEKHDISDQTDQDLDIWKILPGGISSRDDLVIEFGKCNRI